METPKPSAPGNGADQRQDGSARREPEDPRSARPDSHAATGPGAPAGAPAPQGQEGRPWPNGASNQPPGRASGPHSAPAAPYGHPGQAPAGPPPSPYGHPGSASGGPAPSPYGTPAQPPAAAYAGQPVYPHPAGRSREHALPWALSGCFLVLILFVVLVFAGVTCTVMIGDLAALHNAKNEPEQPYGDGGDPYSPYDPGNPSSPDDPYSPYGLDPGPDSGDGGNSYDQLGSVSLQDIREAFGAGAQGLIENGRCAPGVYQVGADKDIAPGRYFFEGSQSSEGRFYVFEERSSDSYALKQAISYFGNYFGDLEQGDVVAFFGPGETSMYPAGQADFKPAPPYQSGLYRVGTDIPAGSYRVSVNADAADAAPSDCAAIVMKDLKFAKGSITNKKYVLPGGSQTISVKDGDWLELYATTAVPLP